METYLNFKLEADETNTKLLSQCLHSMQDYDLDTCRSTLDELKSGLSKKLDVLVEEYGDYIESIEDIDVTETSVAADFVCGSGGLDFAEDLLELLGPFTSSAEVTFNHDEDYDEEESDMKLIFKNGRVAKEG